MRTRATQLDRAPSTVSREISRNGGSCHYRATQADQNTWDKGPRPKVCKLSLNRSLCQKIEVKLRRKWSPQQIAGWLKRENPNNENNHVSHETIYRSLFIQARGAFKKELQLCLRSKRSIRRARTSTLKDDGLGGMPNAVSIRERPASVEDRGTEMTGHQRFTLETNIQVYFCDPASPWQRGSNENTNRLLRDYLPKGTDLSVHSQKELNWIARELNERPRKTLEYETPAARFNACVASTG